jgi:DNA-binding Xre family transcriptional regulator
MRWRAAGQKREPLGCNNKNFKNSNKYLLIFDKVCSLQEIYKLTGMETNTSTILKTMNVVFWIVFIGLCIKTGSLLVSFIVSLFVNSAGAKDLYMGLDLSSVMAHNQRQYVYVVSLIVFLSALKAYIAYLVVRIFHNFNFSQPFNPTVSSLISRISHAALGTGVVGLIASGYTEWLIKQGVTIPVQWESHEFLFLAGIIFIIAQVFKKGIELQRENELTVWPMPIIVNLDVVMAKRKMSLNELSDKVGLTLSNLSILKTGKAKAIRFSTLEAICHALACQPGDILEYTDT